MDSNNPAMGENQVPINATLALPFYGSFILVIGMVVFYLKENICQKDFILLAQAVTRDFSSWVKAH